MTSQPIQRIPGIIRLARLVWLVVIIMATVLMLGYTNSPSPSGSPPTTWPESSRVPHDKTRPTLVMFIHPRCPCSRASIEELARLMAHCQGRASVNALFVKPPGMPVEWVQTDLWRAASEIPGLRLLRDDDGRVRIAVIDNGVGISPENLPRLFNHGFTTRKNGHGFGLHSGALAAKELGGSLHARSDGSGKGAAFILELPCRPEDGT